MGRAWSNQVHTFRVLSFRTASLHSGGPAIPKPPPTPLAQIGSQSSRKHCPRDNSMTSRPQGTRARHAPWTSRNTPDALNTRTVTPPHKHQKSVALKTKSNNTSQASETNKPDSSQVSLATYFDTNIQVAVKVVGQRRNLYRRKMR